MPRLLSRLLQNLKDGKKIPRTKLPPSPPKRVPWPLVTSPPKVSFSPAGRSQSLLLDDISPVSRSTYYRRKARRPQIGVNLPSPLYEASEDPPRNMTEQERSWWSSPYLRMLASPIRTCITTRAHLPKDFLVRLVAAQMPMSRISSTIRNIIIPDGMEHPRFKLRKSGFGWHVVCRKETIDVLAMRGSLKRVVSTAHISPTLSDQMEQLLRLRILQEIELLADRLQCNPQNSASSPVLRRLTRAEWNTVKTSGTIPYDNAIALIVVPPLNKNPITKRRPEPSTSIMPLEDTEKQPLFSSSPLSSLLPTSPDADLINPEIPDSSLKLPDFLPRAHVPLYHGVKLFPSRPQRAALHAGLLRLLSVERRARYREHGRLESRISEPPEDKWARGDQKASHAFLLFSDAQTALRGDVAPLAIALYRMRLWGGQGWEGTKHDVGGWKITKLPPLGWWRRKRSS